MNKTLLLSLAISGLTLGACNESTREDARDVQASRSAIAKDQADIEDYEDSLATNRAQKAAAIARGDTATQAKESLEIGANKAAISAKKGEKKIDEHILMEDEDDLRN